MRLLWCAESVNRFCPRSKRLWREKLPARAQYVPKHCLGLSYLQRARLWCVRAQIGTCLCLQSQKLLQLQLQLQLKPQNSSPLPRNLAPRVSELLLLFMEQMRTDAFPFPRSRRPVLTVSCRPQLQGLRDRVPARQRQFQPKR